MSPRPARTLLVVDDHPDARRMIARALAVIADTVEVAADGQEALERCQSTRYALISSDLAMPELDGFGFAAALRQQEREWGRDPTPLLAVSAYAGADRALRCAEAGFSDSLEKPYRVRELIRRARRLLRDRESPPADPLISDLLPVYLAERRRDVERLRLFLLRTEFGAMAALAHQLAGTGTSYGYPQISALGGSLENAARRGDAPLIGALIDCLEQQVQGLVRCRSAAKASAGA